MTMIKLPKVLLDRALEFRDSLVSMRDDINSNTSECAKLLYRLEEAELQIKNNRSMIDELERRKVDVFGITPASSR